MNATTNGTQTVAVDETKELFLYLDPHDQSKFDAARKLTKTLKDSGFTVHELFCRETDPQTVTPWLIDPIGSSHHGLNRIKAFIAYKMMMLERQSRRTQ